MIIICALALVTMVAVVFLCLRAIDKKDEQAARERSELLTRIQHPNMVMVPERDLVEEPASEEEDEYGMVGQIVDFPSQEQSDARIAAFVKDSGLDDD